MTGRALKHVSDLCHLVTSWVIMIQIKKTDELDSIKYWYF